MIRLVLFLVLLAALAFGGSWLADRPGEIAVVWQGWRVDTTVPVALAVIAVVAGVMLVLWKVLAFLLASPGLMAALSRRRRRERGLRALTRGLLAIGSGDIAAARKARAEAARLLPHEPLTYFLTAQTAQVEHNSDTAVATFKAMAARPESRLLGLRGLYMEARRSGDREAAARIAREAVEASPTLVWAADAVIDAECAAGDFGAARLVLERQMSQWGIDKAQYRRRRAVLLTAEALALEHNDPQTARGLVLEAVRLAPTLVPAAACAGRLLGAAGDLKKAAKIIEAAYVECPHPELAEVTANLRPGDSAQDRLRRVRILVSKAPEHVESIIALARAALDAHEYDEARRILEPLLKAPSQRVCLLMAELEAAESGDIGKAREWTARAVNAPRDPAWIADGVVYDHWQAVSPVTGKLDVFVWAVPQGVTATPILEHGAERVMAAIAMVRDGEQAKAVAQTTARAAEAAAAQSAAVAETVARPEAPDRVATQEAVPVAEPAPQDEAAPSAETAAVKPEVRPASASDPSRTDKAGPIFAMPPLPDDPGPETGEPEPPPPRKRWFFGR